jgi:CheY-like chemotaxis protein
MQLGLAATPPGAEPDDIRPRVEPKVRLGLNVLLAEDNPINALLARRMLDGLGCQSTLVADGCEALGAIEAMAIGSAPQFDFVLMDVHMPRMDGLTAVAELKRLAAADPGRLRLPPIIALTANAFPEDRKACLAAGYDDYISKPFTKEDLLAAIRRWCVARPEQAA